MIEKLYRIFTSILFGTIVFFSGVLAPQIFRLLPHDQAADLQNHLFAFYYATCAACGFAAFILDLFRSRTKIASVSLGTALAILGFVVLTPMIRNAFVTHDPAMSWLHPTAIVLNVVMLLAATYAL